MPADFDLSDVGFFDICANLNEKIRIVRKDIDIKENS
jgi:hypothetical protein